MYRVATIALQRTMVDSMQRSQQQLSVTQTELATGKKAQSYADLGSETARNLSARSMVQQQQAQANVAKRVDTTLAIYDAHVDGIETAAEELRQSILTAVGSERPQGLNDAIQGAFDQYRISLNASEGGLNLFAGSRTNEQPFKPTSLDDVLATPIDAAFGNDNVRATARVADGIDMSYGLLASEVGGSLYASFQTLAGAGQYGETLSQAQKDELLDVASQLQTGLQDVRAAAAGNGRRQGQVDAFAKRADERILLLEQIVSDNEDADLADVALRLTQQQTSLEASYSVFAKLSNLNLTRFLN